MPENGARFMYTSESVNEGHPDKLCDQVSDAVLDAVLEQDPDAKVACETCSKTNMVRDEGGLICPMFNDFIDGVSDKLAGWETDPNSELMNGRASHKMWFA